MSFVTNTNIAALESLRHINKATGSYNRTVQQLASGKRISQAADDPAGTAIAAKMQSSIKSTNQAKRNTEVAESMLQVMDGAYSNLSEFLIRIKELAIQAATDTVHERDRAAIDLEVQSIITDVDRLAHSTSFNGDSLLNRDSGQLDIQVGIEHNELGRKTIPLSRFNVTRSALGLIGLNVLDRSSARNAISQVDDAIVRLSSVRSEIGGLMNALESTRAKLEISAENSESAKSRIMDADVAEKSADLARDKILGISSTSSLRNANNRSALALKLV